MSMAHKAFRFDWLGFQRELAPLMYEALSSGSPEKLLRFVDANLTSCSSPYDGDRLDSRWRQKMETADLQEVANFALTRYYDPDADHGLSDAWIDEDASLPPAAREALLGTAFGPSADALFDPGRMGSYFQSPEQVRASLAALEGLERPRLVAFGELLKAAVADAKGIYVTF